MHLSRIHLNPRCKEARRDLADPYQLHSTLCRAFSPPDKKCPTNEFLWRLEPETDQRGYPRILVQSRSIPDWGSINVEGWLASADPVIDLQERLKLHSVEPGHRYRFRLRANPSVCRAGKRFGLRRREEQDNWIQRQAESHGFSLPQLRSVDPQEDSRSQPDVRISQEQMLRGNQHTGNGIQIFCVLYEGILAVTHPDKFGKALQTGIGHGKAMGLGLLSVARLA
jgi:CRISPR system Cascade subunit CasE